VHYVGVVVRAVEHGYEVQCMRRHTLENIYQFRFPDQDDISIYQSADIITRLSHPKQIRLVYEFSQVELLPFSKYNLR
jgi:hypothetical protein